MSKLLTAAALIALSVADLEAELKNGYPLETLNEALGMEAGKKDSRKTAIEALTDAAEEAAAKAEAEAAAKAEAEAAAKAEAEAAAKAEAEAAAKAEAEAAAKAEAEAAAKAEAEAAAKAEAEAAAKAEAEAAAKAEAEAAAKKGEESLGPVIAKGKSLTSLKGILGEGSPVTPEHFVGGQKTFDDLKKRGFIE